MKSTFTVLVTVEHDPEAGHSASRIAEAVQVALEEGTSQTAPFLSAQVDAFKGCRINIGHMSTSDCDRYHNILPLHTAR